ncbi:MAG: hypothetical protein OEM26_20500, partial [Saprospiraceae bacterium]|nr:hypothetical protein [Saprospiraceae bacterium]
MKKDLTISYLHTTPAPPFDGTDAVHNEVDRLAAHFNGTITNLYPFRRPSSLLPRALYGWHRLSRLRALDQHQTVHHVFSPTLAFYPVLNHLRRPIVFSVSANVGSKRPANIRHMKKWGRIIVSNLRDFDRLNSWGFSNSEVVLPGIDLSGFFRLPQPPPGKFTLLLASAPWEKKQFETKGIDLLLETVRAMPEIKLILLWRGLYINDLRQMVDGL